MTDQIACIEHSLPRVWLHFGTIMLLWMQFGFAYLHVSSARSVDRIHVAAMAVANICLGAIAWWAFASSLYSGPSVGGVLGSFTSFLSTPEDAFTWLHDFVFLVSGITIGLGGTMSKLRARVQFVFVPYMMALIACAAHATRRRDGLFGSFGFWDPTGAGVVHLFGGVISLVWNANLGVGVGHANYRPPPHQRLTAEDLRAVRTLYARDHRGPVTSLIGLHICWIAVNVGNAILIKGDMASAGAVAFHTVLSSAAAGCMSILASRIIIGHVSSTATTVATLAGTLAVSSAADRITARSTVLVAFLVPLLVLSIRATLARRVAIDDPVGIIPAHLVGGLCGVLMPGVLANQPQNTCYEVEGKLGLLNGGGIEFLSVQVIGAAYIAVWACLPTLLFIKICRKAGISLRLEPIKEAVGMDAVYHGGTLFSSLGMTRLTLELLHHALVKETMQESQSDTSLNTVRTRTKQGGQPYTDQLQTMHRQKTPNVRLNVPPA